MRIAPTLIVAALLALAGAAQADSFVVDAKANSSSGGVGKDTLSLSAGQAFTVTVAVGDLWSAGALPRWSNADGLGGNLYASGSDESGAAAGTLIGAAFGPYHQGNLTANFGTLVGQIGGGDYFVVGTNYAGTAASTGTLKLFYWDSNNFDNTEHITANVTAVPEPESYALMLAGLGAIACIARRRQA